MMAIVFRRLLSLPSFFPLLCIRSFIVRSEWKVVEEWESVRRSTDDLSSPLPPTDENLGSERIEEQKREGFGDLGEEFAPFPPC